MGLGLLEITGYNVTYDCIGYISKVGCLGVVPVLPAVSVSGLRDFIDTIFMRTHHHFLGLLGALELLMTRAGVDLCRNWCASNQAASSCIKSG